MVWMIEFNRAFELAPGTDMLAQCACNIAVHQAEVEFNFSLANVFFKIALQNQRDHVRSLVEYASMLLQPQITQVLRRRMSSTHRSTLITGVSMTVLP